MAFQSASTCAFLRLLLLLCLCGCSAPSAIELDQPNVVLISVDDMRNWVGVLGVYEGPSPTPHIDRLAQRGVLFTRAYAAAPLCNPSRTAVFTGLAPSRTGIYNNDQWWRPHLPDVVTMPDHFRASGYLAAGGGKLYHHMPGFNPPQQWDSYFTQVFDDPYHRPIGSSVNPVIGTHWPQGFPLNGLREEMGHHIWPFNQREFDWGAFDATDQQMGDGQMTTWAADFVGRSHDRPFFLAAGTMRPHLPWYAPQHHFDAIDPESIRMPALKDNDLNDVPGIGRAMALISAEEVDMVKRTGKYREAVHAYLAAIHFADAQVGRIVEALDRGPNAGNTIVILWSDHGWHLGEKNHWLKSTLWEEATHVPLIVALPTPGTATAGRRCERTVSLLDIYPTLIELCDLKRPAQKLDGRSLLPLLKNPQVKWDHPAVTTYLRGNHAVRDERYRYIRYHDGSEELYDHAADPHEWTNLGGRADMAAVKRRLAESLPEHDADNAPLKEAYRWNHQTYTWDAAK